MLFPPPSKREGGGGGGDDDVQCDLFFGPMQFRGENITDGEQNFYFLARYEAHKQTGWLGSYIDKR
jgi:hypothetical protein